MCSLQFRLKRIKSLQGKVYLVNKYTNNISRYFYENKYVYIKTPTLHEKWLAIDYMTTFGDTLFELCSTSATCVTDDITVNIPTDMLHTIEEAVLKTYLIKPVPEFIV